MTTRSIVRLLRDPALDWPMGAFDSAETALWMTPILQTSTLSAHQHPMQPMYPLRKLLARARGCYTSELNSRILHALAAIERGAANYHWAFATTHDAWKMARRWESPRNPPSRRPRNLHEHKLMQLYRCFPKTTINAPVQLAIFVGRGVCDHPGLRYTVGPGRIETERPDLIARKYWDLVSLLDFMAGVWLVEREPAVEPILLPLTQFRELWKPFAPPSLTFEFDFAVRGFRDALADWIETQ